MNTTTDLIDLNVLGVIIMSRRLFVAISTAAAAGLVAVPSIAANLFVGNLFVG
ncbi:MAG: hypothetical protein AAF547_03915 [Actinomycetota bacterium]